MKNLNSRGGSVPALVLLAGFAMVVFLIITNIFEFKNLLYSDLFPKPSSQAEESLVNLIDFQGEVITETNDPNLRLKIKSPWFNEPDESTSSAIFEKAVKTLLISEKSDFPANTTLSMDFSHCGEGSTSICFDIEGYFWTFYILTDRTIGERSLWVKYIATDEEIIEKLNFTLLSSQSSPGSDYNNYPDNEPSSSSGDYDYSNLTGNQGGTNTSPSPTPQSTISSNLTQKPTPTVFIPQQTATPLPSTDSDTQTYLLEDFENLTIPSFEPFQRIEAQNEATPSSTLEIILDQLLQLIQSFGYSIRGIIPIQQPTLCPENDSWLVCSRKSFN